MQEAHNAMGEVGRSCTKLRAAQKHAALRVLEAVTALRQGAGGSSLWSNWASTSLRCRLPVRMGFTGLS